MKDNRILISAITLCIMGIMGVSVLLISKETKIETSTNSTESKYLLLDKKLDSLATEMEKVKESSRAKEEDTVKKIIHFKAIPQTRSQITSINQPICQISFNPSRSDFNDSIKIRGQELLNFVDSISYRAARAETQNKNSNSNRYNIPDITNMSFGAALSTGIHTGVTQTDSKVSLDSAKANGLAIMGRVSFPNSGIVNNRASLYFVLTYIPRGDEIKVTSFSENVTEPDNMGSFYHRIFLENSQYKKGLYRIVVRYNDSIISTQNLLLF